MIGGASARVRILRYGSRYVPAAVVYLYSTGARLGSPLSERASRTLWAVLRASCVRGRHRRASRVSNVARENYTNDDGARSAKGRGGGTDMSMSGLCDCVLFVVCGLLRCVCSYSFSRAGQCPAGAGEFCVYRVYT